MNGWCKGDRRNQGDAVPSFCRTGRSQELMRGRFTLAISMALAALAGPAPAAPQVTVPPAEIIVPHRAVYSIDLQRTDEGSGVSSANGRMVFEITGSACQGYRMRQRMVVNIGDEEGNIGLLDFQIATFETGNGDRYSFDARTTVNKDVVEAVEGEAKRMGSGIEVRLKKPQEKTISLDSATLFPSQHLKAILNAAAEKRTIMSAEIYEGAGTGEGSDAAMAAIGRAAEPGADGPLRAGVRHWPVSVGYFGRGGATSDGLGEELPSYQMRFVLYENGVTNDLVMDYGNYALSGSLDTIEALEPAECSLR